MKLTNPQFDKVLEEFWKVSHLDDVSGQMHAATQRRVRAMYTVRSFPSVYMMRVCMDKYGTRDPEHLSLEQLCQLAMTLNKRKEGIDDREIREEEERGGASGAKVEGELVTVDEPF